MSGCGPNCGYCGLCSTADEKPYRCAIHGISLTDEEDCPECEKERKRQELYESHQHDPRR